VRLAGTVSAALLLYKRTVRGLAGALVSDAVHKVDPVPAKVGKTHDTELTPTGASRFKIAVCAIPAALDVMVTV
jgi:hypothetical protein